MIHRLLSDIKKPFLFLLTILLCSFFLGYFTGVLYPKDTDEAVRTLASNFRLLQNQDNLIKFFFIFINNAGKSFFVVSFGALFGIIPLIFVSLNGLLLGIVAFTVIAKEGIVYFLVGTATHGIVELPAFLIAASYGMNLGKRYYRKLTRRELFKPYLMQALKKTFRVIFPLLAVAAFIETFITPSLLRLF